MDIALGSGLVPNEIQKTACHRSAKHGWKHCPPGVGMLMQIVGKMDFAISMNSLIERDIPRFLKVTKRQRDTALVSGLVPNEKQKTTCHRSVKHGWKLYSVGVGLY